MKSLFRNLILLILFSSVALSQNLPEVEIAEEISEDELAYEQIARFTLAMEQIHDLYVESGEEVSYEQLIDGAIKGMMSSLDDYSQYLSTDTLKNLEETSQGAFGGVGIVINRMGEWITVVSPIQGSPGWDAGLLAGDQIRRVDGRSARGISIQEAVRRLRGEPGSEVQVEFNRPSEDRIFEVTLVRSIIETPSVSDSFVLEDGIGYVRIKTFTVNTAKRLRRELTALNRKGVKDLVVDLRGNPGGLLSSAVEVSSIFLPRDTLVVYTQGREEEQRKEYRTSITPHRLQPELVVLINGGSASASEILAGALQDHQRATLVGETSFGKASVQSIIGLPDGSALKLTTAGYFTPNDRQIHEKGIDPDETVPLSMRSWFMLQDELNEENWERDSQLKRAVELLRDEKDE